jgi:hypothetical protein
LGCEEKRGDGWREDVKYTIESMYFEKFGGDSETVSTMDEILNIRLRESMFFLKKERRDPCISLELTNILGVTHTDT